jgi:hypothetical protein
VGIDNASGTGTNTGAVINLASTNGAPFVLSGVRIFRSYPTINLVPLPSTGLSDGKLLRFSITASPSGPVTVGTTNFQVNSTSGILFSDVSLYGFTDPAFSQPMSTFSAFGGKIFSCTGGCSGSSFLAGGGSSSTVIPAGTTYYFELRGTISSLPSTGVPSVVTTLVNDPTYLPLSTFSAVAGANFLWSPNDTGTSQTSTSDWTNGYQLPGFGSAITQARTGTASTPTPTQTGALLVSTDASTPSAASYPPGTTGVVLGVYKFHALNEDVLLRSVGLKLTSGNSSDLSRVYIYSSGGTLLGTAIFMGNTATSTLATAVTIPQNGDTSFIIRGDIAGAAGDIIKVDFLGAQGSGTNSGAVVNATGSTNVAGVTIASTVPTSNIAPTCSVSYSPSPIATGGTLNISWTSQNAVSRSYKIYDPSGNLNFTSGSIPVSGTTSDTSYSSLVPGTYSRVDTVTSSNGTAGTCSQSVTIVASTATCTYTPTSRPTLASSATVAGQSACSSWCQTQYTAMFSGLRSATYTCTYGGTAVASATDSSANLANVLTALQSLLQEILASLGH